MLRFDTLSPHDLSHRLSSPAVNVFVLTDNRLSVSALSQVRSMRPPHSSQYATLADNDAYT